MVHADEIIVLGKGHVLERGPHAELVARGGAYAELWERQASHSADPAEEPSAADRRHRDGSR